MRNLFEFIRRYAAVFLFVILEIVCLLLITSSTAYKQWKGGTVIREMAGPVLRQRAKAASYFHLRKENEALLDFQRRLLQQVCNTDLNTSDSSVTDSLPEPLQAPLFDYKVANIHENTTSLPDNYLILDKGYEDGIQEKSGVITPSGVVGIVDAVSAHHAFAFSFQNNDISISARLRQEGGSGLLVWDGVSSGKALIKEIPLQ